MVYIMSVIGGSENGPHVDVDIVDLDASDVGIINILTVFLF